MTSFSGQSAPSLHYSGGTQGLNIIQGNFNNLNGHASMTNNIPVSASQISNGISNGGGINFLTNPAFNNTNSLMGISGISSPANYGGLPTPSFSSWLNLTTSNARSTLQEAPQMVGTFDLPQLTGRNSFAGALQGNLGAVHGSVDKQGLGVISPFQKNLEFSFQKEDFPALPGLQGASNFTRHSNELFHKDMSAVARNNQDPLQVSRFIMSNGNYHSQVQTRPLTSPNKIPISRSQNQANHQYQNQQDQPLFSQFQTPYSHVSHKNQCSKSTEEKQTDTDRFDLLGLLGWMRNPDLQSLAFGLDLTAFGLDLNSPGTLNESFCSIWSDEPARRDPDYSIPDCYSVYSPPKLQRAQFSKFQLTTLFYIFYSMPKDEAQLYAAAELYSRGWVYHREHRLWFTRAGNTEPLVKTDIYERGSFLCFDPTIWYTVHKENFILHYDALEKKPTFFSGTPSALSKESM